MEFKFPFDGKSISQILEESIRGSKPIENVQLEFKPFWVLERQWDEEKNEFKKDPKTGNTILERVEHVKRKNLEELAGLANTEGGVMLIGVEDSGELVEDDVSKTKHHQTAANLQQTIVNQIDSCFGRLDAGGFRVKHEELESKNGKKVTVFRIDVSAPENLLFVDGKLFKRHGEKTERLNAKEAIELEKRKRKENKILEKEFHDGVSESVKTEYKEISDKFDRGNYQDTTSHLYRLMREVMQEEYDSIDWKIKSFWVLLAVGAGTVGQWIFVAAVVGSLSFFFSLGPLVNLSPSGWLWTIIFALFLTTLIARDECNWIVEHISPGGISIIFSISKMQPPASVYLALYWCIIKGKKKEIDIEVLVWVLIAFHRINEGFGGVIFDLSREEKRVRNKASYEPDEYRIDYLVKNCLLMLNRLADGKENE